MLTVYFDGQCPLCSREIAHYRRRAPADAVAFIDIAVPDFDPGAHGLDPVRANRLFHVRAGDRLLVGVDAFRALWAAVPGFRWLRAVTGLPGVYQIACLLYAVFARVRPLLQRRKTRCKAGQCRV